MKLTGILMLLCFCCICLCRAQSTPRRIVMIGDAGGKGAERTIEAVKRYIPLDSNTIVLFLGDNAYSPNDTQVLRRNAEVIEGTDAKAFFIPGYRDWSRGKEAGYKAVLAQQQYLKGLDNDNIKFYPGDACPGPQTVELGDDIEMIIMDSQWWLHEHNKPDIESDCKYRTKEEVLGEIEDLVEDNINKLVLMVSHHPFENTGLHSGTFGLKQHIFPFTDIRDLRSFYLPLPVIGSLYPIVRNAAISKQDMIHPSYNSLAKSGIITMPGISTAFINHPYTVFIAGQDHNLQLHKKYGKYYIVSGAAAKAGRVRTNKETVFARQTTGFGVLEISGSKEVSLNFYEVTPGGTKVIYAGDLFNFSKFPPLAKDTTTMGMLQVDSVVASINKQYEEASGFQRFLAGENYRKEWAADVKMKIFDISAERGGLKITGLGGGHQTRAMQMEDSEGRNWVLRSVNKNLEEVIPPGFRKTLANDIVQDMVSGSNPYGSLVVPGLLGPLGIVHPVPQVVFVPNDTALKEFRPALANTVCQFEERKPALNKNELLNTYEAINKIVNESDHFVDQRQFLKARMVDFLIADFDRHYAQWDWGTTDTGNGKLYYPVPKDRDQALFFNNGLIMEIARRGQFAYMINFYHNIRNIVSMSRVGAHMDMFFINELTEKDWRATLAEFRNTLNDSVINAAAHRLPPEVYAIRGDEIYAKLVNRKNFISERGLEYYRFISRKVNILGSNSDDEFMVYRDDTGLVVSVYTAEKDGGRNLRYSRRFDPSVTREIRLFGFNGDDRFNVADAVPAGIRFKMIGGKGRDIFDIKGKARNSLYDLSLEDNTILSRSRTAKMFSRDPSVNEYRLRENVHNSLKFPVIGLGYNEDDGLLVGLGLTYTTYGFRKYPHASRQRLSALWAASNRAYQIKYRGEFNHIFRHYDLVPRAEYFNPVLNYFFGFGNEAVRDMSKDIEFYRTRYDYLSADLLVRKRFLNDSIMSLSAGPSLFYYWNSNNPNRSKVLEFPSVVGLDSASVYTDKLYGGGKLVFTVSNLNSELIPMRGIDWTTEFAALKSMNDNSEPFTRLLSTLDMYAELSRDAKLIAALHLGGGHIFSDHFEYFQALTLGGNNYLRGYRRNRFAGSSMLYGSAELRAKLFEFNAHVVKGDFGLVGFNDVGRVWMKGEQSNKWHHGYGGGIYVIPFNSVMLSLMMGFSEEERLFYGSLGTKLNFIFQ